MPLLAQVKKEADINHIQFELNAFNNDLLKLDEISFYEIIVEYLDDDIIKLKDDFEKFLKKLEFSKPEIDRMISIIRIISKHDQSNNDDLNKVIDHHYVLIDLEKDFFNYYKLYVQKTSITKLNEKKDFLMRLGKAFFCNSNVKSLLLSQTDTLVNSFFKSVVGFIYEVSSNDEQLNNDAQLKKNLLVFLSLIDNDQLQLKIKFVDMAQTYERQNSKKFGQFTFSSILINEFILYCKSQDKEKILDYIYATAAIDFNQISNQSQIDFVEKLIECIKDANCKQIAYKTLALLSQINQDKCKAFYHILQSNFPKNPNIVDITLTPLIGYIEYHLHDNNGVFSLFKDTAWKDQMISLLSELSPDVKADKIKLIIQGLLSDKKDVSYQKMEKLLKEIKNYDHLFLDFLLDECLSSFPKLDGDNKINKIRVLRFLKSHLIFGERLSKKLLEKINTQDLDKEVFSYFEFLAENDVIEYFKTHDKTTFLLKALEKDYIRSNYSYYINIVIPCLNAPRTIVNSLKVLAKKSFVRSLNQKNINMIENSIMPILLAGIINNKTIAVFKFIKSLEKENNILLNSALEMNKLIDHFFDFKLENTVKVQKQEMYKTYYKEVQISLLEGYLKNYLETYQQEILCAKPTLYKTFESLTEGLFTNTIHLISDKGVVEIHDIIKSYCEKMFVHISNPIGSPFNINPSKLNLILNDWLLPLEKRLSKLSNDIPEFHYEPVLPLIQSNLFYDTECDETFQTEPEDEPEIETKEENKVESDDESDVEPKDGNEPKDGKAPKDGNTPNAIYVYACLLGFIYRLNPNQILIINSVNQTISQHIKDLLESKITRITSDYKNISSIINQFEDFFKSKDCPEDIIFSAIELVMPTSEKLVEYLNENQSIADEHKKEFLLSMDYILRKICKEIIALKESQDLRNHWADAYQFQTMMKMQKILVEKYPNDQKQIEPIMINLRQQLGALNPVDNVTSNLFQRIASIFFDRSFHANISNLPQQFNAINVLNIVFASKAHIENSVKVIKDGVGRITPINFEDILGTYFKLRYTIANYLRFFDEYGPYQDILKQGFNEIFLNNLQEAFEARSNHILEKLYLKKRNIKIEELKNEIEEGKNKGLNIDDYEIEIKAIFKNWKKLI